MQKHGEFGIRVASKLAKLALVRAELPLRKERGQQVAKAQCIKPSIFQETRWVRGPLGSRPCRTLAQLAFFSVRFESAFMRRMARIATSSAPAAAMGSVARTMAVKLKCYLDVTVAQQTLYCFRIGLDADDSGTVLVGRIFPARVTRERTPSSSGVTRVSCRARMIRSQRGSNFFHPEA